MSNNVHLKICSLVFQPPKLVRHFAPINVSGVPLISQRIYFIGKFFPKIALMLCDNQEVQAPNTLTLTSNESIVEYCLCSKCRLKCAQCFIVQVLNLLGVIQGLLCIYLHRRKISKE